MRNGRNGRTRSARTTRRRTKTRRTRLRTKTRRTRRMSHTMKMILTSMATKMMTTRMIARMSRPTRMTRMKRMMRSATKRKSVSLTIFLTIYLLYVVWTQGFLHSGSRGRPRGIVRKRTFSVHRKYQCRRRKQSTVDVHVPPKVSTVLARAKPPQHILIKRIPRL